MSERLNIDQIHPGDFLRVQIENPHGDRNLDGAILSGIVKEVVFAHRMARLESGWCCHEKDVLLEHRSAAVSREAE